MRALVVDDSRFARRIIKRMLGELGFEVIEASHGSEAMQRLREAGPMDILLVDWNMPEMNGYDFLCRVRASSDYKDVPLMMVTRETEMSRVTTALHAGANEYIMKPFTKDIMADKLALLGLLP